MSTSERGVALRAMINDGSFRAITTRTTELVREACAAQQLTGAMAQRFGELLTGALIVRETMAPTMRVQLALRAANANLLADSHPGGMTRGIAQLPDGEIALGQGTELQVMRVLPRGKLHQGVVETNATYGITGALMRYMLTSEQVRSTVDVCVTLDDAGEIAEAGGFIVQLLPEATDEALESMTEHLAALPPLIDWIAGTTPASLAQTLFGEHEYTVLEESPAFFGCLCSEVRMLGAMATLGREELQSIVASGEVLDIECDYCGTHYKLGAQQLKTLLTTV